MINLKKEKLKNSIKKELIIKLGMAKKSKTNFSQSLESNKRTEPSKNSAKIVLFIFGVGPIIGIIIFLASKGFFNSPSA